MLRALLLPWVFAQAVSAVPQNTPPQSASPAQGASPTQGAPAGQGAAPASPPASRTLTLREALDTASQHQPQIRQARASTNVSKARVEQARSGYLPQVTGTATYQRRTGNFAPSPGGASAPPQDTDLSPKYNSYNFQVNATQLIYDFGQTDGRWRAADATVDASVENERTVLITSLLNVKKAYFAARANKALIKVQEENLANQGRHVAQIEAFVKVGTRPEIDLVQAKTDYANARVQLINAQNNYEVSKASVNQSMGVVANTDYDVVDEDTGPLQDEDSALEPLVRKALVQRPELTNLSKQRRAQELTVSSAKGAYGPSLSATGGGSYAGTDLGSLVPNWYVGATLSWPILSGWQTHGVVHEAEANLENIDAEVEAEQLQIGFDVQQAWLAVRANKATMAAAQEALVNAKEQLRLAEGRYRAGTGSVIELGDAQVAATQAAAQVVQADYNLATARAQLLAAMGRS